MGRSKLSAFILAASGFSAVACLCFVLQKWSAKELAGDPSSYCVLLFGGAGSLALTLAVARWLGLSLRDDALWGRNPSAAVALGGALLGSMFIYAGSQIGKKLHRAKLLLRGIRGRAVVSALARIGTDYRHLARHHRGARLGKRVTPGRVSGRERSHPGALSWPSTRARCRFARG